MTATRDRYEPTQDDYRDYEQYLDSLMAADDAAGGPAREAAERDFALDCDPEEADRDEAARVAAWLASKGLSERPF